MCLCLLAELLKAGGKRSPRGSGARVMLPVQTWLGPGVELAAGVGGRAMPFLGVPETHHNPGRTMDLTSSLLAERCQQAGQRC